MTHVLVAPDKLKGSLTAVQTARAVARGIALVRPDLAVRLLPVADGGDGTLAAALAAGFRRVDVTARGPLGHPVPAGIAIRDQLAVVETAAACGLALLPNGTTAPLTATTDGVGDLLIAALDAGATTVVLGVGGSASTDGGSGLVRALGGRLLDASGQPLPPGGGALADLAEIDLTSLDTRLAAIEVILACDVDNPLLGPHGSAAVFGPQKGASPERVESLERGLRRWASAVGEVVGKDLSDTPGAGCGGGLGFAALSVLGARRQLGIELLLELVGFADQLTDACLVITGEGSLDEQSLRGKAPIGVAAAAAAAGVPTVAVAGQCLLDRRSLRAAGILAAYPLTDLEPDVTRCVAEAEPLLVRVAERIAREWLPAPEDARRHVPG